MGPGFESPKVHQNKDIEYLFNVFVYRGIAQLVESRSPKPLVVGSSPTAPAKNPRSSERGFFIHCESNGISSRFSVYIIAVGAYHQPKAVLTAA